MMEKNPWKQKLYVYVLHVHLSNTKSLLQNLCLNIAIFVFRE
jgi:hypothetical protein